MIAGGDRRDYSLADGANQIVRGLPRRRALHPRSGAHNVALTDAGIHAVETMRGCGNLFDER